MKRPESESVRKGVGLTDPEKFLAELEPVGWRFGLDRMWALCEELGWPQREYRSLHVVGTNGKSSVTLMTAALLAEAGLRSGACVSPHVWRWSERTRIAGDEIGKAQFAAATAKVAAAVKAVEAGLPPVDGGTERDRVTQFEAAIASSLVAFADAGVDAAVVEAGLGGRLDATNVLESTATALTSVGLDHVEWLGGTEAEIAREKLAVLRPGSTLVLGHLSAEVEEIARAHADEGDAALVAAKPLSAGALPAGVAPFSARNAAVAVALAETIGGALPAERISAVLGPVLSGGLPGRAELFDGEPPLIVDAAHNEGGAAALAEALPGLARDRPVFACVSVLADKDAGAIARAIAPGLEFAVCTAADPGPAMGRPGSRATDPDELAREVTEAGVEAEAVADPELAIDRTLGLARDRGGVALFAGSHYLLRHLWNGRHAQNYFR